MRYLFFVRYLKFSENQFTRMQINGLELDKETRCRHWHSEKDIIAIQFACCGDFYACYECHDALTDHSPEKWPAVSFDKAEAIYCGRCETRLSIQNYMDAGSKCPNCGASFNPGCEKHWPMYFDLKQKL